ncbi:MAG: hypothetical protein GEV05_18810 [Betaproteobacteria bacterium]|nr:hypothetical protein [Betaproteobacteria bacterium]
MKRCKRCLLPEAVPGSDFDSNGVCRPCREYRPDSRSKAEEARKVCEADLERTLKDVRGSGQYDCLVPLSGGKDSVYLIHRLKNDYGLRVLAHTTDINIGPIAWSNIRRAVDKLDVEHLVYRPSMAFYRKLFRFLLMNQEARGAVHTISYAYGPLFESNALRAAVALRIPLVLAGYSPGQPVPERMLYEFPRMSISQVDWTPPELRESGLFDAAELARFWNPGDYPAGTAFPRYLAPYHAWPYNQDEIMSKVVELGLIDSKKKASPVYSNYPINWLLMYSDLKNFGYNPYAPEFSALIREGKASRLYWTFMAPFVDWMIRRKVLMGREVSVHMEWLGLNDDDLAIRRPSRPEWPQFVYEQWRRDVPWGEQMVASV